MIGLSVSVVLYLRDHLMVVMPKTDQGKYLSSPPGADSSSGEESKSFYFFYVLRLHH